MDKSTYLFLSHRRIDRATRMDTGCAYGEDISKREVAGAGTIRERFFCKYHRSPCRLFWRVLSHHVHHSGLRMSQAKRLPMKNRSKIGIANL